MPEPKQVSNKRPSEILSMMRAITGNVPMPVAFTSEEGNPILLDEMIQTMEQMEDLTIVREESSAFHDEGNATNHRRTECSTELCGLEPITNECQYRIGPDDVCGLPRLSPAHRYGTGHKFVESDNAGVAQSEERRSRKAEAGGSIPPSSSKPLGLNHEQQEIIIKLVHHRVQVEDNRKAIDAATTALKEAEKTWKAAEKTANSRIEACKRQGQIHIEQLKLSEEKLRQSILEDAIVRGTPEPEPIPPVVEEETLDIGRAE